MVKLPLDFTRQKSADTCRRHGGRKDKSAKGAKPMNKDSERKIREEYSSYQQMLRACDDIEDPKINHYLRSIAENCHFNARWGNVADVYTILKNAMIKQGF